ncbi:Gfo/Idh/MocA family protein [Paenibacillus spongiae]|uniref:Gfo/Idh/MocA family oxidoreductase n=1 Tax=Paenibacillus spongiae TaxID=2909671 RepID=A0ABY5SCN1_9BACL|nr:Gfo/Idh/MocA family oxidoreductase [Paenibacillus spongiae]UVI30043.1 Gfo/Idh/MocA family oxidoreductase [Paenibacillus spongiae]
MSKRMNIAVIGAGDMGNTHVGAWQNAGHRVVSVTDISEELAKKTKEKYGIPNMYLDYREAAADPEIDIVSICLPLALHAPVTIYAAEQGKHVFCEKPLARSFEEVKAMEAAVNKAGVHFGIGLQRSFANSLKIVKQMAADQVFGHPMLITSTGVAEVRPKRLMHDANGNMGPLMDNCCHYFMMWKHIFQSRPKSIYCIGDVFAKDRPELSHIEKLAIDTAVMSVKYESGDMAEMVITWGMAKGFQLGGRSDRLYGPRGGAEGDFTNITGSITIYEGDQRRELGIEGHRQSLHAEQFQTFAQAIEQGIPAPVGFQDGKEMLTISLAAIESAVTGRIVEYKHPE